MPDTDFKATQMAFAAHIRDPQRVPPPPGIEDRRMAVYRSLFFNNLKNLLSSTFPVLRKLHEDAHWQRLIRDFMRTHRSRTPYFLELPAEFLDFLSREYQPGEDDFPFLVELAHYEHIELALSISTASNDPDRVDASGDLLTGVPVRSALCEVYAYSYPVHRISPDYLPEEPLTDRVHLAITRDDEDRVRFSELNPLMARLLEAVGNNPEGRCGRRILEHIAAEVGYADVDAFLGHGTQALETMRSNGMLLGIRKN